MIAAAVLGLASLTEKCQAATAAPTTAAVAAQSDTRESLLGRLIGESLSKVKALADARQWRRRFVDLHEELEEFLEKQDEQTQ